MSIFLGSQLEDVIGQIEQGAASASKKGGNVALGVTSLPELPKDATDRNRTSPFAFTGNKFEFRAVGSSAPIYWPQTVLNTAVADSLKQLADELDELKPGDFDGLTKVLSPIVKANKQVLFEGNGYSEEWHAEAARRGLPNNRDDGRRAAGADDGQGQGAVRVVRRALRARAARRASTSTGSATSRSRTSRPRARIDIARTMILPAAVAYLGRLSAAGRRRAGVAHMCERVAGLTDQLVDAIDALEHAQHEAHEAGSVHDEARAFVEDVIPAQAAPARGGRRARDARRRRPLAAAEVPGAALPVLSLIPARSDRARAAAAGGLVAFPSGRPPGFRASPGSDAARPERSPGGIAGAPARSGPPSRPLRTPVAHVPRTR